MLLDVTLVKIYEIIWNIFWCAEYLDLTNYK
jgi:hypothetical protein